MDFAGKTVIVTGAGYGVGRAIAIGFCADGANVVGISRSRNDIGETAALCEAGRMHPVAGDITVAGDVLQLYSEAIRRHGKVDILVNNAARYPKVTFLESSIEDWSHVIQTNIVGMARCCHIVLPGMLERGFGRIINLGTFAWQGPIPCSSAYSASKAAVRPLTRALAGEIDRERYPDVLVNELIPGIVKSRMSETGDAPGDVYPHARFVASLPRGGATGQTFLRSELLVEVHGIRARVRRILGRISGAFARAT